KITDDNKAADEAMKKIEDQFSSKPGKTATQLCNDRSALLIAYDLLLKKADTIIANKKALAVSLQSLVDFLAPYTASTSWRGKTSADADLNDYLFPTGADVDFEKQNEITVTASVKAV